MQHKGSASYLFARSREQAAPSPTRQPRAAADTAHALPKLPREPGASPPPRAGRGTRGDVVPSRRAAAAPLSAAFSSAGARTVRRWACPALCINFNARRVKGPVRTAAAGGSGTRRLLAHPPSAAWRLLRARRARERFIAGSRLCARSASAALPHASGLCTCSDAWVSRRAARRSAQCAALPAAAWISTRAAP